MPWFQIADAETGRTATAANQGGEILVKTPGQFTGYWNNPDATRSSFDSQGWFQTGTVTKHGRLAFDSLKSLLSFHRTDIALFEFVLTLKIFH